MWLSGLHIPESYLTALVQATCRAKGWALDRSTLYSTVTEYVNPDDIRDRPSNGCFVQGLFLEGASWDRKRKCLAPPIPKQLVQNLPVLRVIPIEAHKLKLQNTFRTPVRERRTVFAVRGQCVKRVYRRLLVPYPSSC